MSKKDKRAKKAQRQPMTISPMALAQFLPADAPPPIIYEVKPPQLPPGVQNEASMAMDSAASNLYDYANIAYSGMGFAGYPRLAMLAQYSEYRAPVETIAAEMTREWIKITSRGDDDLSEKIGEIEQALKDFRVQSVLSQMVEHDGFFGRGQVFIDMGTDDDGGKQPLVINKATIKKGSLRGFKNIEPMWTVPLHYDSVDPTSRDFYRPTSWVIMAKETHASRLMTLISRPLPDMLKPAYNFSGMSLVQLLEPYVQRWMQGSDSIPQLMKSFSLSGIKTEMSQVLSGGGGDNLLARAKMFNLARDNRGLMLLDKEMEEFFQFNTPLSGLDKLWAMLQEHMAAVCHIPLVKLTGVTPTGLNASSEGEIKVFYDYIKAQQDRQLNEPIDKILKIIQLHLFGEIDPAIGFEFNPLEQMNDTELAAIQKSKADGAAIYLANGVIDAMEERKRLAADPLSGYASIDVDDVPEMEMETDGEEGEPEGTGAGQPERSDRDQVPA